MVRRTFSLASISLLLAVGGCGGSDKPAADKSSGTEAAGAVDEPADSATDVSVAEGDSGDTVAPPVAVEDTAAEGDGDSGANSALANLPALDTESMCALLPSAETEAIVGPLGRSGGNLLEGLGTNCYYEVVDGPKVLTSLEFSVLTWAMGAEIAASAPADPPPVPCTIGGLDAECTDSYLDTASDYTFDARVTVKLGGDNDPTMSASAPTLDQAIAIAELALSKLAL
jgi:hypothetical protein